MDIVLFWQQYDYLNMCVCMWEIYMVWMTRYVKVLVIINQRVRLHVCSEFSLYFQVMMNTPWFDNNSFPPSTSKICNSCLWNILKLLCILLACWFAEFPSLAPGDWNRSLGGHGHVQFPELPGASLAAWLGRGHTPPTWAPVSRGCDLSDLPDSTRPPENLPFDLIATVPSMAEEEKSWYKVASASALCDRKESRSHFHCGVHWKGQ